jgi:transcriptional regulator with XRE-family HTH domain
MREHGTLAAYKIDLCKCDLCEEANRTYVARRARLKAYGQWEPYVDAEPVREHVRTLIGFGLGWMQIAKIAGVPRGVMSKLLYGDGPRGLAPSKRVRPHTAAKILAVEPSFDMLADGAMVDGTATRRRLQALVAVGWAQARLAERLGVERTNLNKMLRSGQHVRAGTVRAVARLYDELWDQAPPESEHRAKISASRARNYARAAGWLPPMAWDDDTIDDPAACGDLGQKTNRADALFEDSEELLRQGFTVELAAERLGVSPKYLSVARSLVQRREDAVA